MSIYTKTGDDGNTRRSDGARVAKHDLVVSAAGELDELAAMIGWCIAAARQGPSPEVLSALEPLPKELMTICAILAANGKPTAAADPAAISRMERQIDAVWRQMGELKTFILPGGCELACRLHLGRTVCRRAERSVSAAAESGLAVPPAVFAYLNRLSDLLFALARLANHQAGVNEETWGK